MITGTIAMPSIAELLCLVRNWMLRLMHRLTGSAQGDKAEPATHLYVELLTSPDVPRDKAVLI